MKKSFYRGLSYLFFALAVPVFAVLMFWDFKNDPNSGRGFSIFSLFSGWFWGRVILLVPLVAFVGLGIKFKESADEMKDK